MNFLPKILIIISLKISVHTDKFCYCLPKINYPNPHLQVEVVIEVTGRRVQAI